MPPQPARRRGARRARRDDSTAAWLAICAAALPLLTQLEIGASQAAAQDGNALAALQSARSAIRLQPWASEPYLQLALVSEQAGRLAVADTAIRRAIARSEDDWQLWLVATRIQTKRGRVAAAVESLRHARDLNPRSPSVRSRLEECALRFRSFSLLGGTDLAVDHVSLAEDPTAVAAAEPTVESRVWWRDSLRRRMLAAADAATVTVFSLSIGVVLDGHIASAFWAEALLPVWIVLAKMQGLYDRDHRTLRHLTADEVPSILLWVVTGTAATIVLVPELSGQALPPGRMVEPFLIAFVTAVCFRCAARRAVAPHGASRSHAHPRRRSVGARGSEKARAVSRDPCATRRHACAHERARSLGARGRAAVAALDRILLAAHAVEDDLITALIGFCRTEHVKLSVVPPARGQLGAGVQLVHVAELPVLEYNTSDVSRSTILLKRLLDVCVASLVLVLALPLAAIVAVAIGSRTAGPVFFGQTRAGVGGRPFTIWKFRTMVRDAEAMLADLVPFDKLEEPVFKLARDPRVTRVGRLLRRFSLDELPQLVNVLRGDMSLVGPRPEQAELVERYGPSIAFGSSSSPG